MKFKRSLLGLTLPAALAIFAAAAKADVILLVDLSTVNQVTISATAGLSAVTTSGSDTTGVYLENFYGGPGNSLVSSLVSGNLTNAENPSDGSPVLFRGGSGSDLGLNIWSFSPDATVTFTTGSLAFVGSGTWTLTPLMYADMLNGSGSGNVYFPADTVDDLSSAELLGTYDVVTSTAVPEPTTLSLMVAGLGLAALGRRRTSRSRRQS